MTRHDHAPGVSDADASAPGQFYGYSLQITRTLARLLRSHPGQAVSVEHMDDVATYDHSSMTLEQDKSGLSHNPVANRSIELWKTLHNWIDAIRGGALAADTTFVMYLAQPHTGTVLERIDAARTMVDAQALVAALRDEYWGPAPERKDRSALPAGLAKHVDPVLSSADDVLAQLFMRVTVERGTGAPNDDLLLDLREKAISEDALEGVMQHLLGWTKTTIDRMIEAGTPAVIPWELFNAQLVGIARKLDRSTTVLSATGLDVTQGDIERELRDRIYIRQLQAVQCPELDLERAVRDFLRAAVDRTAWGERGDVVEGSFQEFEDGLQRAWAHHRDRVEIEQQSRLEEERGRLLHASCMIFQSRLQGMDVPSYFVPGSFHSLADARQIGWHPRYREILAEGHPSEGPVANGSAVDMPIATSVVQP